MASSPPTVTKQQRMGIVKTLALRELENAGIPEKDVLSLKLVCCYKDRWSETKTVSAVVYDALHARAPPTPTAAAAAAAAAAPPTPTTVAGSAEEAATVEQAAGEAAEGGEAAAEEAAAAAAEQQADMDLDVAADLSAQPSASGAAGEAAAAEDEDAVDLSADVSAMGLDACELAAEPAAEAAAANAAAAEAGPATIITIKAGSRSYACTIKAYHRACKQPKNSKQATKANHQPPKRRPRNSGNSGNSGSNKKKDWQIFLHTPETLAAAKRDPTHKYLCMITEEGLAQLQASFGQQRAKDWDDVLQRVQPWVSDDVRERLAGLAQQPEA